jgi:hypothetical protein
MRHFLAARPVATRAHGMGVTASAAGLKTLAGGALSALAGLPRAAAGAIDLPAITAAADHRLSAALGAQKQPRGADIAVGDGADAPTAAPDGTTWTIAAIAGIVSLHACPARCGARRRVSTPSSDRRRACPSMGQAFSRRDAPTSAGNHQTPKTPTQRQIARHRPGSGARQAATCRQPAHQRQICALSRRHRHLLS